MSESRNIQISQEHT